MADYEFRYAPLTGRLTGKQMIEQTEQAINGLASLVDDAAGQVEIISTLANEANENAATALETAEEALATTGRTYITVSIPADANNYYDSQLIYIADNTSTNIPVADTGMLETKTNDNKTACEQVFIADSSGASYYRHGDITAETVGDVTTYTVTWGGWSSEPASQTYVQGELANYAPLSDLENYLPLSGGTMTGLISKDGEFLYSTVDTGLVRIGGGTGVNNGALLTLWGKNHSNNPGEFRLRANNGNGDYQLIGRASNGTLTWKNENILTDATVGTVVTKSVSSASISIPASTATTVTSVSLAKGTWVINGNSRITSVSADKIYGLSITTTGNNYLYANEGIVAVHSSQSGTIVPNVSRILTLNSASTVYLCCYATAAAAISDAHLTAVRII